MKTKSWMILSSLCVALALAGCTTYPEGPYVAVAKPNNPEAANKPVILLNSGLTKTLAVDRPPSVERNANGLLKIQVGLRNRLDDDQLRIAVQTLFFSETGKVLYSQPGSEAAWQILTLSPNQTTYYTQQSLTSEAARYTVRVRYVGKRP